MVIPTARRINRGRGHSYEIDGEKVPGITTIIGKGIAKPALIDWAGRVTAGYAIDHWDELSEMRPSERLEALNKSRFTERDTAAVRGTAIHTIAQQLSEGQEVDVPEPLTGHVDAYLRFVEEWQPKDILVEEAFFNRALGYAGTPDLLADLNDGQRWLLDWKTGAKGIFPEFALQLAAARYAEFWVDPDGEEQPIPNVDQCGCIWLRADGYDLVPVAADTEAFRVFLHAKNTAAFADENRERWVGEALHPGRRTAA